MESLYQNGFDDAVRFLLKENWFEQTAHRKVAKRDGCQNTATGILENLRDCYPVPVHESKNPNGLASASAEKVLVALHRAV